MTTSAVWDASVATGGNSTLSANAVCLSSGNRAVRTGTAPRSSVKPIDAAIQPSTADPKVAQRRVTAAATRSPRMSTMYSTATTATTSPARLAGMRENPSSRSASIPAIVSSATVASASPSSRAESSTR